MGALLRRLGDDFFGCQANPVIGDIHPAIAGAEGDYLGLETLTFAPIDRTLVDQTLLTRDEVAWWNDYHAKVEEILAPQLSGAALDWLKTACAPL